MCLEVIMMTVISIGYPRLGRLALLREQFIEEMKQSGFIRQAMERDNLNGAVVPK